MLTSQPLSGDCELHGDYETDVKLVTIEKSNIDKLCPLGPVEESILSSPIVLCSKCRIVVEKLTGQTIPATIPSEETMSSEVIDRPDQLSPLLERFFAFQNIFPDIVGDIYLVPQSDVVGTRYADKPLNVVVGFRALNIQAYTAWAVKNNKSAAHLWNTNERGKMWSPRMLRILLALGKLHLSSTQFSVWVASYTRIVSIEYFCSTPPRMVQITPSKLYKVK